MDKKNHFLEQDNWLSFIDQKIGKTQWQMVYHSTTSNKEWVTFFCSLVPNELVESVLENDGWDFDIGKGFPGCITYYNGNERTTLYFRYGNDKSIEPLIIKRDFHGIKPDDLEISEEFRLFHNLYYDYEKRQFLKIGEDGNEQTVIKLQDNEVQIRLLELKQFLALKEMHLAIYFDIRRYSVECPQRLLDLKVEEKKDVQQNYKMHFLYLEDSGIDDKKYISWLQGKKLISPLPKEKSGLWPYESMESKYESFIIKVNEDGEEIQHTCNPEELSDYFGKNPDAPNYLTPVFFRNEVLSKYYNDPSKYTVEDGILRCANLWTLYIDNNLTEYISVYLGDLGSHIPHSEQLYWKSFNICPATISSVNFRRSFLAEFAEPKEPTLLFKSKINAFRKKWKSKFGWELFRSLHPADQHYEITLRIPSSRNQKDFDHQILSLAKILIESINNKKISELLGADKEKTSINNLSLYFKKDFQTTFDEFISFLKVLHKMRSQGVAHFKSSDYEKTASKLGTPNSSLEKIFENFILTAIRFIDKLDSCYLDV